MNMYVCIRMYNFILLSLRVNTRARVLRYYTLYLFFPLDLDSIGTASNWEFKRRRSIVIYFRFFQYRLETTVEARGVTCDSENFMTSRNKERVSSRFLVVETRRFDESIRYKE